MSESYLFSPFFGEPEKAGERIFRRRNVSNQTTKIVTEIFTDTLKLFLPLQLTDLVISHTLQLLNLLYLASVLFIVILHVLLIDLLAFR